MTKSSYVYFFTLSVFLGFATRSGVFGAISFQEVEFGGLVSPPYRNKDDDHLMLMNSKQRRDLCNDMSLKTPYTLLMPEYTNNYYVTIAHMYKLGGEDWIAIRCPTMPALYISHETVEDPDGDSDQWYLKIVNTQIDQYKFVLQTYWGISTYYEKYDKDFTPEERPAKNHIFHQFDVEKRWIFCTEAEKLIRYQNGGQSVVTRDNYTAKESIRTYEFRHLSGYNELYIGFQCFKKPPIYLHTSRSEMTNNVIFISLEGYDLTEYEPVNSNTYQRVSDGKSFDTCGTKAQYPYI